MFKIGDRVQVTEQPAIVGTVVAYDFGTKLIILDDDWRTWAETSDEGTLVFRADELRDFDPCRACDGTGAEPDASAPCRLCGGARQRI